MAYLDPAVAMQQNMILQQIAMQQLLAQQYAMQNPWITNPLAQNNTLTQESFLMNPLYGGYSPAQIATAMTVTNNDLYSTLGGVGIQNLGLTGVPGLGPGSDAMNLAMLNQTDRLFTLGLSIGGPNSLVAQLAAQSQMAPLPFTQQFIG